MSELPHLSLFSGIGGVDLAAEWAGFQTVGQVERDPYCRKVLQKNFQNTHIWNDIHDLTIDTYRGHCGEQSPTLLSGGFPCQPFSVAGKQKSTADDRYLWPEMFRVVQELRPTWILGENVPGIISLALDDVLSDLEGAGYSCRAFLIPACGVGALHKRDRCFILANSGILADGETRQTAGTIGKKGKSWYYVSGGSLRCRSEKSNMHISNPNTIRCDMRESEREGVYREEQACHEIDSGSEDVSNPNNERCKECDSSPITGGSGFHPWAADPRGMQWETEPAMGRVVDGIPSGVDRLRCLGNAVVPQQVYPILQGIADIERN